MLGYILGGALLILLMALGYLWTVSRVAPPRVDKGSGGGDRKTVSPGFYVLDQHWFRKSASGLYELYIEGAPYPRGVATGKLTRELILLQEDYFYEQIVRMIPSRFYLHFLKYFISWFNRNLDRHVIEEYREEIYGVSLSASDKYPFIGTNYQRILNYHAAHDIGHALQSLALVGCTSFGTWGDRSEDGKLLIGRNFDFYVGDKFAENKIIALEAPLSGYKFLSVTWGGFIGVVSGMNERGLTVTINAAKSSVPSGSATPVSLVAREILQYAATIEEAIAIARQRDMFVSESFLIGSAIDRKAVIIEKTPDDLDVYDPGSDHILCANHFQSEGLAEQAPNKEQLEQSASPFRYQRLEELLAAAGPNTVEKTISILRDHRGAGGADIGLGNERTLNQFIAHHAVVFAPEVLKVWVSTTSWQLGAFVCYDLNEVLFLNGLKEDREIIVPEDTIPPDPFLSSEALSKFRTYWALKRQMEAGQVIDPAQLVAADPEFFHAYVLAGDYLFKQKDYRGAQAYYTQALTKVVASQTQSAYIQEQIKKCTART